MEANDLNTTNRDKVPPENEGSLVMSWAIVLAMAAAFLLWGFFIFFIVGVSWPPPWRYGIIDDVPGQSIYSVQGAEKQAGTAPWEEGEKIRQQHVMGKSGEVKKSPDQQGR